MAKKYYANVFVVDTAVTPAESIDDKFAGQTIEVGSLLLVAPAQVTTIAAEATANGSDAGTTQALANALKTKLNAVIAAMKTAKLMA